jgi:hypothetical protein
MRQLPIHASCSTGCCRTLAVVGGQRGRQRAIPLQARWRSAAAGAAAVLCSSKGCCCCRSALRQHPRAARLGQHAQQPAAATYKQRGLIRLSQLKEAALLN